MPNYGTSEQQMLMQQMAMARMQQQQAGRANQRGPNISTIDRYMEEEYERQKKSKRGQWLQSKMALPGMAATMAARTKDIDKTIAASAKSGALNKLPTGELTPEQLTQYVLNAGGGAYLATSGLANVSSIKRRAASKQYEGQLGGLGKVERGIGNLSAINRIAAMPRVASLIAGQGMPRSVQGSMGLYGSSLSGMLPFMGAQIGLAMWKSARIKKIKAQRTPGGEKAAKISDPVFNTLDEQASMLQRSQGMKPGEGIIYQALRFIGSSVAVNPLIYEELAFIREEREKGREGLSGRYGEAIEGEGERDTITRLLDSTTGALDKTLAKYDIGTQLFNFFTTGQLPKTMQDNLEAVWEKQGISKEDAKTESRSRGISMDQHRIGMTSARTLIEMAPNVQMQEVALLSGIFDTNRYILLETEMIRRGGFGVQDSDKSSVDYNRSALGKVWGAIKEGAGIITNIPGINAIANMLTLPFKMPSKVLGAFEKVTSGISRLLVGGRAADMLSSEEELQKAAGIYKSSQEAANEYLAQGLPNVNEDIRMLGAVRAQILTNIYQVVSEHLRLATGASHTYDTKAFGKEVQKGAWSMTAGKYLSERGLLQQEERDRGRMEIALERGFRGSLFDVLGSVIPGLAGAGVGGRLRMAAKGRQWFERIPFLRTEAAETFAPEQLMEAAMFRQRGIRGRDVGEAEFFDPELERRMMEQQNIGPRLQRFLGRGAGGLTSLTGGALGITGALTGGVGLLPMALMGLLGLSTGVAGPAKVRMTQAQEVFGGKYEGMAAEEFLGVRGKAKKDLGREGIQKIERVLGPKPRDWYQNPANQVLIAAILQTPDVASYGKGTFAGGGPLVGGATPMMSMSADDFKKDPMPVAIYGFLRNGQVWTPDDYREGVQTKVAVGQDFLPDDGDRSLGEELKEVNVKKERKQVEAREERQTKLMQQSAEATEEVAKNTENLEKALSGKDKEGFLGKIFGSIGKIFGMLGSALPMLLGGAALSGLSFMTGGALGTKAAGTFFGKGISALLKGPLARTGIQLIGKTALKSLVKKIPFLGFAAGLLFGFQRMVKGDYWGGMLELASGLVSMVPGIGTIASLGIDAWILKRDWSADKVTSLLRGEAAETEAAAEDRKKTVASLAEQVKAAQEKNEELKRKIAQKAEKQRFAARGGLEGIEGLKETDPALYEKLIKIKNRSKWWKKIFGDAKDARSKLAQQEAARDDIEATKQLHSANMEMHELTEQLRLINEQNAALMKKLDVNVPIQKFGYGGVIRRPSLIGERGKDELNLAIPLTQPEIGEFGRKIDAAGTKNELAAKVSYLQQEAREEKKVSDSVQNINMSNGPPSIVPVPVDVSTDKSNVDRDRTTTVIDKRLDRMLSTILADASFEFSNRYIGYVYESNRGYMSA